MLDTIREYAAARLVEAGESARLELALRDYVLRTAERSLAIGMAQVPVPWAERVDCSRRHIVDESNITQVLTWCLAHEDTQTGLRICIAVSPRWLVWGIFAEGGEWLDAFLDPGSRALPPRIRGAALVARAQLALASDPAAAEALAEEGLALCRDGGEEFWTAVALNLLSEIALQTGRADDAVTRADQALSVAQAAGDGWNEGYALGTRAAIAARAGKLAAAAAALRESAGVPPLPPARTETYLAPARHLGEPAVARLWARGLALSSDAAVALAVEVRPSRTPADGDGRGLTVVAEPEALSSRIPGRAASRQVH